LSSSEGCKPASFWRLGASRSLAVSGLTAPRKQRPAPAGDDWNGYRWLPLRAGRVATSGSVAGNTLHLTFPQGEAWTPGDNPDVLIFPGGEMTPFRLTVGEGPGIAFNARGESLPEPQEAP
jgi:general secretion pathway protein H